MKDLQDYLHLYLGQECTFTDTDGDEHIYVLDYDVLNKFSGLACSLILRPLSDMKEEEMVEFVCLQNKSIFTNIDRTEVTKIGWSYKDSANGINVSWYKRQGSGASTGCKTFHINQSDADQIKYLLSRGFDLFMLIKSGLAIDKTKV